MTSFTISTIGDPVLHNPVKQLSSLEEAAPVFEQLTAALRELKGAGLAAPQIGIGVAAAITEVHKNELFPGRPESPLTCLANPVITDYSDDLVDDYEACFSVPDLFGITSRSTEVTVTYRDAEWNEVTHTFSGYIARVVQHEVDHLNQRVFLSRMQNFDSLMTREHFVKKNE